MSIQTIQGGQLVTSNHFKQVMIQNLALTSVTIALKNGQVNILFWGSWSLSL
ncbi:MAG: hypothetical protein NWF06_05600 [Candidatus Bathyarchaeota archaeon]|nr:hypothetical protein [Candidatus Bathyarchaeum sp.]